METAKLKDTFHFFFNKINNIFTAVGANKIILEENIEGLSQQDLKERITELAEALKMIEKNILLLNDSLQEFYTALKEEKGLSVPDSSNTEPQK